MKNIKKVVWGLVIAFFAGMEQAVSNDFMEYVASSESSKPPQSRHNPLTKQHRHQQGFIKRALTAFKTHCIPEEEQKDSKFNRSYE